MMKIANTFLSLSRILGTLHLVRTQSIQFLIYLFILNISFYISQTQNAFLHILSVHNTLFPNTRICTDSPSIFLPRIDFLGSDNEK